MEIELIYRIKESLERDSIQVITKIEFDYLIKRKNKLQEARIDLMMQINNILYLFEIKKSRKLIKAMKQLKFHKEQITKNRKRLILSGKVMPFSKIKTYYISEDENIIINIENKESSILDPLFIENPLEFLLR